MIYFAISHILYIIIIIMTEHAHDKYTHLYSLTNFKHAHDASPAKSTHIPPSIYLRYRTTQTKSNTIFTQNQPKNPQKQPINPPNNKQEYKQQQIKETARKAGVQAGSNNKWLVKMPAKKQTTQEKSHRKNSTPNKLIDIYEFIKEGNHKTSAKMQSRLSKKQYENNKKLIEKLLSLRFKVKISPHPHFKQNRAESNVGNDSIKMQREKIEKIEGTSQGKHLNYIIESLKSELDALNMQEDEFKEMLSKKKRYDLHNNRPYSNREIYDQIRNTYKVETLQNHQQHFNPLNYNKKKAQTINFRYKEGQQTKKYKNSQLLMQRRRAMVSQQQLRNEGPQLQGW